MISPLNVQLHDVQIVLSHGWPIATLETNVSLRRNQVTSSTPYHLPPLPFMRSEGTSTYRDHDALQYHDCKHYEKLCYSHNSFQYVSYCSNRDCKLSRNYHLSNVLSGIQPVWYQSSHMSHQILHLHTMASYCAMQHTLLLVSSVRCVVTSMNHAMLYIVLT